MAVTQASGMVLKPTAVQSATTENYVSALTATSGDLHKRDVSEKLVKRYGDQGITGLLELMGAKAPTTQTTFEHYEEAFRHNDVTIRFDAGGAAAAATAVEVLTVQANSIFNSEHALRVGDILRFADGDQVYVQARTATTVDVFPLGTGGYAAAKAGATDLLVSIVGNAFPEGSSQPEGLSPRIHEYSNKVQIIKESFSVTGSEATNVVYVKVDNQEFGSGYLWYLKGESDTYKRYMDFAEIQMITGEVIDNAALTAASVTLDGNSYALDTLRGSEGLIPFVENKGQTLDLASGTINLANFDDIVKSLDKFRGAKEYALYNGIDLSLDIDDMLANLGTTTTSGAYGANYGSFNNDKDMAVNLGFSSFVRGGYTIHKKTYDLFNHPKLLGMTGAGFPGSGLMIPMDTQKDAKSGDMIPSLRIRYKAANGYSRDMEHWLTGSAVLANKTNTEDVLKSHYRCERGFEGFAPNRFMWIKA